MYVFNNFIIRTRGDQTSLTLRGGLCVDRTVCAELSLAHFSSLIPVPNDVIKFSEGWLSAYHVPSNTRALGTWKHLVGVALFTRGPVRVEDERDAQRPHLAVPSALGSAGGQEGAEAETGLGLGTFHGIPPEGQKHRVCPKHLSAHGRSCLTFKSGTEVPFKARRARDAPPGAPPGPRSHLHDVDGHGLRLHPLHGVHQPVHHLCADEAARRQALLLREQLDTCPEFQGGNKEREKVEKEETPPLK